MTTKEPLCPVKRPRSIQIPVMSPGQVLKWLTVRFYDTNPAVIIRGLEYLEVALQVRISESRVS